MTTIIALYADLIITFNLKDFPQTALQFYGIEARHPDTFITRLMNRAPESVFAAVKRHRRSLKNPPQSVTEYLRILKRQGLPETVTRLREYSDFI